MCVQQGFYLISKSISFICFFNLIVVLISDYNFFYQSLSNAFIKLSSSLIPILNNLYSLISPASKPLQGIKKRKIYIKKCKFSFGGIEGSRTPVQTYSPKAFYMFILESVFVKIQEPNKPIFFLAG
jgi:hypothetical protein